MVSFQFTNSFQREPLLDRNSDLFTEDYSDFEDDELLLDSEQVASRETLERFFEENSERVFYSRQIEVIHEKKYFHWLTNRAIRDLVALGKIREEKQKLSTGGSIKLLWQKSFRYYKRSAKRLIQLVEEYSHHDVGQMLGLHGETMVWQGFAIAQFVMKGQNVSEFNSKVWTETEHDLDFVFEKDSIAYGVEVKTLLAIWISKSLRLRSSSVNT